MESKRIYLGLNTLQKMVNALQFIGLRFEVEGLSADELIILLKAEVRPGVKKNSLRVLDTGELKCFLMAAPKEGEANKSLVQLVSKKFGIAKGQVELVKGLKSKKKFLKIHFRCTRSKNLRYYEEKLQSIKDESK